MKKIDLTGQVFGRLTVLAEASPRVPGERVRWACRCQCGVVKQIPTSPLRSGVTLSCGCLRTEGIVSRTTRHGMADGPLYGRWKAMKDRCLRPAAKDFLHYGGRGIRVCEQWLSFDGFFADMGSTFKPHLSLERIDNDGNYEPSNCRWATPREQQLNKRSNRILSLDKRSQTVQEWGEELGIHAKTILSRMGRGWSAERALTEPIKIYTAQQGDISDCSKV